MVEAKGIPENKAQPAAEKPKKRTRDKLFTILIYGFPLILIAIGGLIILILALVGQ